MVESCALATVEESYRWGRFLDAWSALPRVAGAVEKGRAQTLETRLLQHLGAPKRAMRATLAAYRADPHDAHGRGRMAFAVLERRGALAARDWMKAHGSADETEPEPVLVTEQLELETLTLVELRDFASARRLLDTWAERGIARVERMATEAYLLTKERRMPEAVALARAALEEEPCHRRLVMLLGSLLVSSGRTNEAVSLLRASSSQMQCAPILQMLYAVALGSEDHALCAHAVDLLPALLPLAEPEALESLTRMRAETLYRRGDADGAHALVANSEDPITKRWAARLALGGSAHRRKRLDVPFVLQEHLGCVPATLAAISRFHGREADHLELAERICYHGTAAHAERSWAESQGFLTREMRLTWDTAVALVERDVPFVVTTMVPGSGHAQALMGFDERRRTFIFRDPSLPLPIEADADAFLEEFRHSGPRCLVIVPRERAATLDGVVLEDAALYDLLYELERALDGHDRERAVAARARLAAVVPDHRIARAATRAIAAYDENPIAVLEVAEASLAADADDAIATVDRLMAQQAVAPRSVRLGALEAAAAVPDAAPIFHELLANELADDAREHTRVRRLSNRVLRQRHDSARSVHQLGQVAWQQGDAARGLELFRFAACLEPTNEGRVRQYVYAARKSGRFAEALAFLRGHFETLGARSADPAILLADALDDAGDGAGASAVLELGTKRRPDDGKLLLVRSRRAAAEGRSADARALLEAARGKIDEVSWSRGAAVLTATEGASEEEQLAGWQRVGEAAPLASDVQSFVATLLRRTQGQRACATFLAARAERFPHHRPTVHAHLASLRESEPREQEAALRRFLEAEPADAWAHRELAILLAEERRHDEAAAAMTTAAELGAGSLEVHLGRAVVAERRNDLVAAREAYLAALAVDADAGMAMGRLLELEVPAQRHGLVQWLFELAERSAIADSTFENLHAAAAPHVAPSWFDGALARLRAVRPELAAVWILSIRHALGAGPPAAATELAAHAVARFALVPEVHLEAAQAWSVLGDQARAIEHLERAVELGPQLSSAVARLADALEARGDTAAVDALLERARRRALFDSTIALEGIRIRVRRGELEAAITATATLLERDPELHQAWNLLLDLAARGPVEQAAAVAAAAPIAASNPGSEAAQSAHAMLLLDAGGHAEALALLDRAAERGLRSAQIRDTRATALAFAGRHDEALAQCAPLAGERPSPDLGMRASWVHLHAGRMPEALNVLEAVLRDHPSRIDGWFRLGEWSLAVGNTRRALDAATRLVSLAPLAASSQAMLAKVLLAGGDRAGAKLALARTIERDPGALDAAEKLFALAREDRDAAAARVAGPVIERLLPEAKRIVVDVDMALVREQPDAAVARFGKACLDASAPEGDVIAAGESLVRAQLGEPVERTVAEALKLPTSNAAVGRLWMRAGLSRDTHFPSMLRSLSAATPNGRSAALEAFEILAQNPYPSRTRAVMKQLRRWLAADDVTWSAPLTTLVAQGSYWGALWWGRSWTTRRDVPPDRLHVLAVAMHALGLRRRALTMMRRVAAQTPDNEAAAFRAWIAFDEVACGRTDEAARLLALVEDRPLPPVAFHPAWLAGVLVEIQRAPRAARARVYEEHRAKLEAQMALAAQFPSLRDTLGRCRRRLARDVGSVAPLFRGIHIPVRMGIALAIGGTVLSNAVRQSDSGDKTRALFVGVVVACVATLLFLRSIWRFVLARV